LKVNMGWCLFIYVLSTLIEFNKIYHHSELMPYDREKK
jgi:hypothetical protein